MSLTKFVGTSIVTFLIPSLVYADSFTVSKSKIFNVFGGVFEKYDPIRLGLEFERNGIIYSPFIGMEETNFEVGFDFGLKQKFGKIYSKEGLGVGYESKKFERHDFRNNFHIIFGLGVDMEEYFIGGVYEHYSIGNAMTRYELDKKNDGINTIGLQLGIKF
jgi:hypothetical protein